MTPASRSPAATRGRSGGTAPLLGEWACLGILHAAPAHGFAVAAQLTPSGEVGRVWSLSRPLTYRALDLLGQRGWIEPVGEEPGIAGGNRTILRPTRAGRAALRAWLRTPVPHLRDLRSELLLKLVVAQRCGIDVRDLLVAQRALVERLAAALPLPAAGGATHPVDVVALWRHETALAALRALDHLLAPTP